MRDYKPTIAPTKNGKFISCYRYIRREGHVLVQSKRPIGLMRELSKEEAWAQAIEHCDRAKRLAFAVN